MGLYTSVFALSMALWVLLGVSRVLRRFSSMASFSCWAMLCRKVARFGACWKFVYYIDDLGSSLNSGPF